MKKPILHIPSVISQSCFTDTKGEVVDLKETQIDYFYLLLFLYSEELLRVTPNLLLKNGDRYYFNELISYNSVEIELNMFHKYGVVDNYQYDDLKLFIDTLSELSINTNLLKKNKDKNIETIKIIDTHSLSSTLLTINFTKNFLKELIGVEKYFMKVNLDYLFNLSGRKTKQLYLLLKDYSKIGNKDLKSDKLKLLIGKIPQKNIFDEIMKKISDVSDIKVSYDLEGVKNKTYKFKMSNKINLKSTKPTQPKDEINTEIMEKSKKKLQQMKNKGVKIENEDGYLKKIYDSDIEKTKPITPKVKTDDDFKIEKWIQTEIYKLKQTETIQYQHNNYLMVTVENDGKKDEYFINDDYLIYNRMDVQKENPITTSSEMTNVFFDYYEDKIITKVYCSYGYEIDNCNISKIRRD